MSNCSVLQNVIQVFKFWHNIYSEEEFEDTKGR